MDRGPRSHVEILATLENPRPANIKVSEITLLDTDVARKTYQYAKEELPEKTFNHSMRVYYYGTHSFILDLMLDLWWI